MHDLFKVVKKTHKIQDAQDLSGVSTRWTEYELKLGGKNVTFK